ncbi:hypothetical protein CBM2605_A260032 [Cupriavidus neocaledonicus]|uniref:Uncharacterized protein n=1 Tax=Cupriavidus neocaledonicus TaxID=1040979 RepID=A0ABY1V3M4_9BURK|nr:hypothetical protein CBM2605_A260032 [Cupriavidus neocaledonicus]
MKHVSKRESVTEILLLCLSSDCRYSAGWKFETGCLNNAGDSVKYMV